MLAPAELRKFVKSLISGSIAQFFKVVLPQAMTGIAATAIFCMIFSWNEYAFAVLLTQFNAQTAPPFIPTIIGEGGLDWPAIGAGTTLFLIPVMIFTVVLRKHILRGIMRVRISVGNSQQLFTNTARTRATIIQLFLYK